MSVRRRQNFLGQQRVDVPHLKSIESAVSNDFDELIKGLVIGENKKYVIRGLEIDMGNSIGGSANNLQLIVENSAFLHGASNESGTFYTIPADTLPEPLNSTTNKKVIGAFTPSTNNYIGLEFLRSVDDTTTDQVYFWNPTSNIEFSKTVPLAVILNYKIVITTSSFASNVLPIAIVKTDSANNIVSITDRRPLLYRLGIAGDQDPDPFYNFPWLEVDGKRVEENFYTSKSSTANPFIGGDKQITTMKDFFDALMTEIKILKGTSFWYSESVGSLNRLRQDLANTVFTGKGSIVHGSYDFQGKVAGMATDVIIKTVKINSTAGNITLTSNGSNLNTLISSYNSSNSDNQIYLYTGDGTQIPTANIVLTSKSGQLNWNDDIYLNFVGGNLRYAVLANEATANLTLTNNQIAYLHLTRGQSVIPNLIFTQNSKIVTSVGATSWTTNLRDKDTYGIGDFIKVASKGDEYYYEIKKIDSSTQVTLVNYYLEESSDSTDGVNAQYTYGSYDLSPTLSSDSRYIQIADRSEVVFGEDYFWLFYRQDDDGSVAKIYARTLNGQEIEQGESRQISDNTTQNILEYIGSSGEFDIGPDYTNALGSARTNIHLIDNENLTKALKRLEQRNDTIPRARVVDLVSTTLPIGASVTIDTEVLVNGDYVLFINSAIEGLYKVSGVGVSVSFEKMYAFSGSQTPTDGDMVRISGGTSYLKTVWKRIAGYWKPLEVADAANEPTGFPNRTDSVISFNNTTRTFSISPASTSFDIFSKGRVFRFNSAQQITIPNTEGIYFFYFETNGTLTYSTVFDVSILTSKIYVSNVYWSVSAQKAIVLADERHGITMDGATHEYLHSRNGAVITSGGAINFASSPTGAIDADAQISLSNMVFRDEDIRMDITNAASPANPFEQTLSPIAKIPVYYRNGVGGLWLKDNATNFPVKQGTSRIQYNNPSGPWTQVDATEGWFVSMWVFATNNISEPVIAILGQNQYSSLSSAQAGDTYNSLSFGTMPVQEFKVLYRIIFQTSSAFANTPKTMVVDVRDLRSTPDTQFAQIAPNDHGSLSGLADPDHAPTAVTTVGVTKDGGLSSSDTDLQQSLDTLNKLLGQLVITEHPVNKKRVKITGANRLLNSNKNISLTLENLLVDFDGAEIDFSTGNIYKADGITALGINFTPSTIPLNNYIYYSITMVLNTTSSLNQLQIQFKVTPASSSNASKSLALRASFVDGMHVGQVVVRNNGINIYDISTQDIVQISNQGPKKLPFTTKGDLLVFNGDQVVRLPVGNSGEILTVNPAAPEGVSWQANAGTSKLGLDENGNFNLELVPQTTAQWVLQSPGGTRYQITIDNNGFLSTTVTTDPVSVIYNLTNSASESCQILVDNSGVLSVISPPLIAGVTTPINLLSPNGYNWKITIVKNGLGINEIVTDTYNNQFLVKTENQNHFAVKQSDEANALVYVQVYNSSTLPSSPLNITGLLPFCFYNNGVSSNLMYYNGSSWVSLDPAPSTVSISALNIDWLSGNLFTKTISTNSTFTFSNNGDGRTIVVRLINSSASALTLAWPASVLNATTSLSANKTGIYTFVQFGANIYMTFLET